jgi:hypothetical protein
MCAGSWQTPRVVCAKLYDRKTPCICCARWPPALRAAMRQAILRIPFTGPVCDDCLVAFMTNVWAASKQAKHH